MKARTFRVNLPGVTDMARPRDPAKRAALVAAVTRVVAERGVHGVTVPGVAQAAGVGTATFYRHFTNVDGLLNAAYRAHKTELLALVPPLPAKWSAAALEVLFSEAAAWARRSPQATKFLLASGARSFLDDESEALSQRTDAALKTYLAAACPPTDDALARLWVVSASLNVVLARTTSGRSFTPRAVRSFVATLWRGLGAA